MEGISGSPDIVPLQDASAVAALAATAALSAPALAAVTDVPFAVDAAPLIEESGDGLIALRDVLVAVRSGGVNVRAEPSKDSAKVGNLREGEQVQAVALIYGEDLTWLQIPWQGGRAWIAAEFTDFPRSTDYDQAVDEWYEFEPVLRFRRHLIQELLRVRGATSDKLEQVNRLSGDALAKLEDALTRQTMLPDYVQFWQLQAHLGLPNPFDYLPVQPMPPATITDMEFTGFGPNTFAFNNWQVYYETTRGMDNGVDYFVPEGSPLIAVADGMIVDFRFLGNAAERSVALRPYLPEKYRKADGTRILSNMVVAYGHLTGDPTSELVRVGDEVRAGQIIGTSGWPVYRRDDGTIGVQTNNAHLHLETHLIRDGDHTFGSRTPFNPMLFWSPRLIAWQARLATNRGTPPYPSGGQPFGKLGFFTLGAFAYEPKTPRVWEYEPSKEALWPPGVYTLEAAVNWVRSFMPYPLDGSGG